MRLRSLLMIMLATFIATATSGCVVAETIVLTTHMRHDVGVRDFEPSEIRAKQATPRAAIDVPAESDAPATP